MHADPIEAEMGFGATNFTQGGVNLFTEANEGSSRLFREFNVGREGFVGWMGLGGSIFQWHPEHGIGFSFVPTALHVLDILNERGKKYQAEVLSCIENLSHRMHTLHITPSIRPPYSEASLVPRSIVFYVQIRASSNTCASSTSLLPNYQLEVIR